MKNKLYRWLHLSVVSGLVLLGLNVCNGQADTLPDVPSSATVTATATPACQISAAGRNTVGFTLSGTWSASFDLQVSNDGVNWADSPYTDNTSTSYTAGTAVTADGTYGCTPLSGSSFFRLVCTSYASGTAMVSMRASTVSAYRPAGGGGSTTAYVLQTSGDGTTVAFVLGFTPSFPTALDVSVGGLRQRSTTDFTYSSGPSTITFGTAPPAGTNNVQVSGI